MSIDLRSLHQIGGRDADSFYRDRWSHDEVVRSTRGVSCTGSCSWKVYVEGLRRGRDHHLGDPADRSPLHRAGPPGVRAPRLSRGAAFPWYTYSPTRVRSPYVRGSLLRMYREAKVRLGDPALAAPAGKVGAVTGIVGATGGLGGFALPLVMCAIYGWIGNYW